MSDSPSSSFPTRVALLVGSAALVVAVVVGVVAAGGFAPDQTPSPDGALARGPFVPRAGSGPEAPDFDLAAFNGDGRVTAADFESKPLVLNFWASWCPFCIEEMPAFERAHQTFKDDVAFLGVNLQDDVDLAKTLVDRTGVTYPLAIDDGDLFTALDARAMPTTVLITADGHIARSFGGRALAADELEEQIVEHLIEPA